LKLQFAPGLYHSYSPDVQLNAVKQIFVINIYF